MKLESLNDSLFENFQKNEIVDSSAITGGRTGRRKDCNASGYDADNSGWRKDSSDSSDTVSVSSASVVSSL
jgi:hypothetical protein